MLDKKHKKDTNTCLIVLCLIFIHIKWNITSEQTKRNIIYTSRQFDNLLSRNKVTLNKISKKKKLFLENDL